MPSQPGVYWFLDDASKILYVGKAKNLKNRVRSYTQINQLSNRKKQMVYLAEEVKWEVLTSELEALLIEAELIRLHQPEYNVLLKDDKSPLYVHISKSPYASVELIRKRDLDKLQIKGTVLGPYRSAYQLKQVLKIARRLFPWCDKAESRVKKLELPKNKNPQSIQTQMKNSFRQACFYHHLDLCPGACIGEIAPEEYQENLKELTLFLRGQKKTVVQHLSEKMKTLADKLKFEQAGEIKKKIELIENVTSKQYRLKPDLVLPALHDQKNKNGLDHLRRILIDVAGLPKQVKLNRIEGYDVSNIMGKNAAVSLVCFTKSLPDKKNYRLFNIREIDTPNDYQMMQEALKRRQNHTEWGIPDLVVIDGGKGQVRAALSVWNWRTPIVGLVKHPDRLVIPTKVWADKKTGRLKINYRLINLPKDHPALLLLEQVRDESHRFAKKQHTKLRRKNLVN